MKWFSKRKKLSMSGLIICDGKNHHWTMWKRISVPFMLRNTITGEWKECTKQIEIQERNCQICGFIQQRDLDER